MIQQTSSHIDTQTFSLIRAQRLFVFSDFHRDIIAQRMSFPLIFCTLVLCIFCAVGCSSTRNISTMSVDEIYKRAVERFDNDDLFEAQRIFDVIKLQYPASDYADDAQYYLAQIHFKRKEYILSAYNFNYLRRVYPSTSYAKEALYRAAQCYVELSPPFDRDQDYTRKAILALQEFQAYYPKDSLSMAAEATINELRDKLAEREYRVAEQYIVLRSPRAALVYLDAVIDEHPITKFGELGLFNKAQILLSLKRYDEVATTYALYRKIHPNGLNAAAIEEIFRQSKTLSANSK